MITPIDIRKITSGRTINISNNSSVEIDKVETTNWKLLEVKLELKEIIIEYESKLYSTGQYFSLAELLELYHELEEHGFFIEIISQRDEISQNLTLRTDQTNFRIVERYEPSKDNFQVLEIIYSLPENVSNRLKDWRNISFGV